MVLEEANPEVEHAVARALFGWMDAPVRRLLVPLPRPVDVWMPLGAPRRRVLRWIREE